MMTPRFPTRFPTRFQDRHDAARQLVLALKTYEHRDVVVVAVPRGAVPMAAIIADHYQWPLEVVLVKKIGHPLNSEYAIGAVGLNDVYLEPGHEDVSESEINEAIRHGQELLHQRQRRFIGQRPAVALRDKIVLIVDDGIATGATLKASVAILRQQYPAMIIIAAPVASSYALDELRPLVEDVIVLHETADFRAVGEYYDDFSEVTDDDVAKILNQFSMLKR